MKLKESLDKLYVKLSTDEILLRLLHYVPKNASDNPLDLAKKDILTLPVSEKFSIIDNVLIPTDKTYDLTLQTKICRLLFYTGTREPLDSYNRTNGRLQENPYASMQKYNFDVYVHVDIDIIDARLTDICDRINELMLLDKVNDVGDFVLDFGSPIANTPDGFLGFKLVYKAVSLQQSELRKWQR